MSDEAGMIVISGTGSAVFCQARGSEGDPVILRAGGWGSLLGDGGSAFSVSRSAVRRLLALLDEGRTPDAEDFFGRWKDAAPGDKPFFNACSTAALIALSMRRPKRELAALAPGIAALAEQPDDSDAAALCREILVQEADALAGDVRRLLASLDHAGRMPETKLPVVLTGGFFAHTPLFCALFREPLERTGLWDFACVLTALSARYLGGAERSWTGERSEELLEGMMCDILSGGNFGKKDRARLDEARLLVDREKGLVSGEVSAKNLLSALNVKARRAMPFLQKAPLLLPLGWGYVALRHLGRMARGSRPALRLDRAVAGAEQRSRLYRQLRLFGQEQDG